MIDVPPNARTLTLPNNDLVRIMAITGSDEHATVKPAQPLYDTLEKDLAADFRR
jgi:alpha-mannosidase